MVADGVVEGSQFSRRINDALSGNSRATNLREARPASTGRSQWKCAFIAATACFVRRPGSRPTSSSTHPRSGRKGLNRAGARFSQADVENDHLRWLPGRDKFRHDWGGDFRFGARASSVYHSPRAKACPCDADNPHELRDRRVGYEGDEFAIDTTAGGLVTAGNERTCHPGSRSRGG